MSRRRKREREEGRKEGATAATVLDSRNEIARESYTATGGEKEGLIKFSQRLSNFMISSGDSSCLAGSRTAPPRVLIKLQFSLHPVCRLRSEGAARQVVYLFSVGLRRRGVASFFKEEEKSC